MIFQSGRSVLRLHKLKLQLLDNGRTGFSSFSVERVPAQYNVFQSQHDSGSALKFGLTRPGLRRTYAQSAVSRPKAHTGRTTAAAKKAPTTSKTKAAKKPAPKKTSPKAVPKAKSTAKPRIKPKPKPAKKKKAKAKPKPKAKKPKVKKPKKVLTEAEKTALTKKRLKAKILSPPHKVAENIWTVFFSERMKGGSTGVWSAVEIVKQAGVAFKELTPEQVEHYNHLANQNKAANNTAYRQWIESHTPTVIYEANVARQHLTKLGIFSRQLRDHRQVKGRRTSYAFFVSQRLGSGDFRGLKVYEAAKLVGREWKALSASEKKPFSELAAQDLERYVQERKTVLNKDVQFRKR